MVDPINRNVIEHRPDPPERVWAEADELTVEDVIPGFRLSVRDALEE